MDAACKLINSLFEHAPAVLVIVEHIEAGAGGRQQHDVARRCRLQSTLITASCIERARLIGRGLQAARRFCRLPRPSEQLFDALANERRKHAVITAFIFAAEDHDDLRSNASSAFIVESTLVAFESL